MSIPLLKKYIRSMLLEEPGRSWHTPNNDPEDWMEQEGVRVISYFDHLEDCWHITVEKLDEKTGEWEDIKHETFKNQEEAAFWSRQQVDKFQRKKFAGNPDLANT